MSVAVPDSEAYYGYTTNVTDASGNTTASLFRKALVNTVSPFASLLASVSGTIGSSAMTFTANIADSVEISGYSLQMEYPNFANLTWEPSLTRFVTRGWMSARCSTTRSPRRTPAG